ncbi:GntR family transcriptional regulator [Cohnella lubricantis]|uniref:GntR family transcriptional regulator n=1 Tax=Cohnella lubricantis TaxID=2163172 RepID=A0A841T986_9BACL|nr:GntR family transcriptional regulator [Cohnella lubricantis]MBB6676629.1 GntR family transcriptional regulator [Cohnella lubricantis]MBP2117360.1 GntR family transcriptional regulator of gluconate operon [Cohnella lubricantis]
MRYPESWLRGAPLGEGITCELRMQIISGALKPGETLSENRIAADFGTSRSPVREAMKTLSSEGLIRLERMGAVVIGLGEKEVDELYDVRFLIESFAQQRMAGLDTGPLIVQLGRIIDKMELAAKHMDPIEFAYQDLAFHETIIAEAKHSRIWQLWKSIRQIVMTVMLLTTEEVFSEGEARVAGVIDKHRKLLNGIQTNDPKTIERTVRDYFADSYVTLHDSISPARG